jgi:hypothetical protein
MSITSLGMIGSLASGAAAQRTSESDKASRESVGQTRAADAAQRAENAAGIGQTEEDSQAADRDADGRRPWEHPSAKSPPAEQVAEAATDQARLSKDPTGESGAELDLLG